VLPDAVLISLSLPHDMGFTLYQMLRAYAKTKDTPIFALSVKTATEEQERAQQAGFSGIITKPINIDHLVTRITHTLYVATASDCFERRDNALVLKVPGNYTPALANEIAVRLRPEVVGAVDAGLDKMIIDLSQVQSAKPNLIKLVLAALKLTDALSVRHSLVGSRSLCWECHRYEESKHWQFADSYADALAELQGKAVTA
jgi:two-component system cell cycle response regulator